MAVDWITNKLYWTDTGDDTISVLDLNTNVRKTLFNLSSGAVGVVEPRAIVIDPLTRLILSILKFKHFSAVTSHAYRPSSFALLN